MLRAPSRAACRRASRSPLHTHARGKRRHGGRPRVGPARVEASDYREGKVEASPRATPGRARVLYSTVFFTRTFVRMATSSKAKKRTVRIASGRKRARQDVVINAQNSSLRSRFRTVVKNVNKAMAGGDKAQAVELFKSAQSVMDSVADKGIVHKNKAARLKSRLNAKLKALALAA